MVQVRRTPEGRFEVTEDVEEDFDFNTVANTFQTRDEVDCYLKGRFGGWEQVGNYLDYTIPQSEAEVRAFELGLSRDLGIEDVTIQEWETAQMTLRQLEPDWRSKFDSKTIIRILRASR